MITFNLPQSHLHRAFLATHSVPELEIDKYVKDSMQNCFFSPFSPYIGEGHYNTLCIYPDEEEYSLVDAETSRESGAPNHSHHAAELQCSDHPTTFLAALLQSIFISSTVDMLVTLHILK